MGTSTISNAPYLPLQSNISHSSWNGIKKKKTEKRKKNGKCHNISGKLGWDGRKRCSVMPSAEDAFEKVTLILNLIRNEFHAEIWLRTAAEDRQQTTDNGQLTTDSWPSWMATGGNF